MINAFFGAITKTIGSRRGQVIILIIIIAVVAFLVVDKFVKPPLYT